MLVLITYDVSTVDADGKRRLRQVATAASFTVSACRIPYLSALWMPHSTSCFRRNFGS